MAVCVLPLVPSPVQCYVLAMPSKGCRGMHPVCLERALHGTITQREYYSLCMAGVTTVYTNSAGHGRFLSCCA